jgi:rhamnogalacturonan endolyase
VRAFTLLLVAAAYGAAADYVLVRGGLLRPGQPTLRLDDFEMAVHPVTNAEYKVFVDETGYPPPLHWEKGRIPAGFENHPVIFVNRSDAWAYARWLSRKEKRTYRLPTAAEFEYAARAGVPDARYPWGDAPPDGRANYDAKGDRNFADWRKHLKPVKSYPPNAWGLYDMAGNVWQMVDTYPDPATAQFKYRIESPELEEGAIAGGSWARGEYYLRCGVRGGASAGIRHPDLGFRLVREPAGATHFQRLPRRVIALPTGGGAIYIGWQLLPQDPPEVGFHVYRATRRDVAGERITPAPVRDSTNFVDRDPPKAARLYYRVRAVMADGKEGPPSEWAGVNPSQPPGGAGMRIAVQMVTPGGPGQPGTQTQLATSGLVAVYQPTVQQGGFAPVFGDLDGDGVLDVVLRLDNGIREMSRDPGVPVELEAFTSYGRSLWRRPLVRHDHCFGNANNVPVVVWDLDGDGKAEVICRLQEGEETYVAVLDGMSGRVRRKAPWTPMVSDFSRSSTRIHMSVAYLDGKRPAIITQTGLYENEVLDAWDAELNKLWTYRSFAETNGSGSHHIDIADVDGDGRDEVFNGTMLLNPDGHLRWALYRGHPDIVAIKYILPGLKTRQVYYVVETSTHAGVYLVDASTGKLIWKVNREDDPRWTHGHVGWASDIWDGSPGMELLANRDGHEAKDLVLFSADGKVLLNPFPSGWRPVNWTGGPVRDLMRANGREIGRFDGKNVVPYAMPGPNPGEGSCPMVADLWGDYRDEVVCYGRTPEGASALMVYTNIQPIARREVTRTASREYRLWIARNIGGGYASYFEWQP